MKNSSSVSIHSAFSRGPVPLGRALPAVAAAGLTALLWWGAAAESDRRRHDATEMAAAPAVHITLPTVVVVGRRQAELRDEGVAGLSDDCRRIPALPVAQRTIRLTGAGCAARR